MFRLFLQADRTDKSKRVLRKKILCLNALLYNIAQCGAQFLIYIITSLRSYIITNT
jgi:hypothetical protein